MVKIYKLIDPNTLEIRYVGKTVQELKYRLSCHISRSKKHSTTHVNCWIKSLLEEGKRPTIVLIEEVDKSIWEEREKFWILELSKICSLTNHQEGGGTGHTGRTLSPSHRKNISESLLGKPRDKETRLKISKGHKGKKLSEVTKEKLRVINLGKIIPLETRLKMSKGGVLQINLQDEIIAEYYSLQDAVNKTGFLKGNISSACTGRLKTYKGFKWKYKNKDIV